MMNLNFLEFGKKSNKAEALLQESERRFRETLENVSLVAVSLDRQGQIIFCNDFLLALTGWQRDEILSRNWFDTFTSYNPKVKQIFLEGMQIGNVPLHNENYIITRSGEKRLIAWSNTILRESQGKVIGITGIGEDITERTRMQEEQNLIKIKLELALQSSKMGVWQYNLVENKRNFDNQVCFLMGIDSEKFSGSEADFFAVVHPDDREMIKEALKKTIELNVPYETEYRVIWPDGSIHYITTRGKLSINDEGIHQAINGIIWDVTERKQADEALIYERSLFRTIIDLIPDAVYVKDVKGRKILANPKEVLLSGKNNEDEVIGKTDFNLLPDFDAKRALSEDQFVLQTGKPILDIDGSLIDNKGDLHYLLGSKVAMYDRQGNITGLVGVTRDITERKKVEDELARERYLMRALMDNLPDHIYFKDLESKFVRVNKSHAFLFGFDDPDLIIGKSDFDFFTGDHSQQAYEDEQTIIRTGQPLSMEERETYHNRPDTWVLTTKMPFYDKDGIIQGTFGISRDITSQKLFQNEIKLKNEELQKLNAEKDKFFSIIAHDLRNPLGSFMGYTEMMVDNIDTMNVNEIQTMAIEMKNSAYNLYNLLENLLEWSRIERGIAGFDPKLFLLMPKIKESMQPVLESAYKKDVEIGFNIPEDMSVFADENMLKSTIRNLATNAVKFTSKGGKIILNAKSVFNNFVEISFKDTGIGMNKDILDKLFRLDAHVSRPGTEGEPSSGLGLILCKDFIDKQGGKIWVESEPGKGSVFYFTIPNTDELTGKKQS